MAQKVAMFRGDVLPELLVDLVDYDPITLIETPKDLSAPGIIVTFKARPADGGAIEINGPLTAVDAVNGKFKFVWAVGDTDTAGEYLGEISIEYPDSPNPNKIQTVLQFDLSILEDVV
jgi:hypothetical protein